MAVYAFGSFELDTRTGELRRQRTRVRLRPQPCAALVYLIERPGQFVCRQELHRALWPEGTFVRFEDGLNSCVKQIRAALGDSRTTPRYLETLTRRGYRFIAPVTVVPDEERASGPHGESAVVTVTIRAEVEGSTAGRELVARRIVRGIVAAIRERLEDVNEFDQLAVTVTADGTAEGVTTHGA